MNSTPSAPSATSTSVDVVNILIVDDEPNNLLVLETVLDDPGYRLVRAGSGEHALLELMAHEFALLVLDVRMPGMTGFELAQMIKQRKRMAQIPIIFLTAYDNDDQHILQGYDTGAVDYLHKPVNAAVLRSKVAVFAQLHRTNRTLQLELAERRRAEARLNELTESLDRRVRERTEALMISDARLRDVNRRKDEFLATLAHELRNPLAPVRNAVQVLRHRSLGAPELQWGFDVIDRQIQAMSRLIDDLMDVSRINQGKIELRLERVNLTDVLSDAVETSRPLIDECNHRLELAAPTGELALNADRTRLAQVFMNLLINAAKYMDSGGHITLSARQEGNHVLVTVKDQGVGIAKDRLAGVFELFSQVETELTRARGGLGIGLSLTQRLVEMHGGSIEGRSEGLGKGSEFEVRLPIAAECSESATPAPQQPALNIESGQKAAGLRILLADDNNDAAETLATLLEIMGHDVRHVSDGEHAVRMTADFDPQLVLLDIGMPKLNGYDACRQIRAQPGGKARTLIAVTGWGQPDDKSTSQEAGFDQHLVKPVDPAELNQLIASLKTNVAT